MNIFRFLELPNGERINIRHIAVMEVVGETFKIITNKNVEYHIPLEIDSFIKFYIQKAKKEPYIRKEEIKPFFKDLKIFLSYHIKELPHSFAEAFNNNCNSDILEFTKLIKKALHKDIRQWIIDLNNQQMFKNQG